MLDVPFHFATLRVDVPLHPVNRDSLLGPMGKRLPAPSPAADLFHP